jgi:hypothetical protein
VHGLEAKWGKEINFVYLDIDDGRTSTFKRALGYRYQPHLFLIDGEGMVLRQWVGLVGEAELEQAFLEAVQ